jgi:hypothetical protein
MLFQQAHERFPCATDETNALAVFVTARRLTNHEKAPWKHGQVWQDYLRPAPAKVRAAMAIRWVVRKIHLRHTFPVHPAILSQKIRFCEWS